MEYRNRTPMRPALQVLITVLALAVLLAAYAFTMHAIIDVSRIDQDTRAGRRDLVYSYVHVAGLIFSGALGFALGKWFSGLGVAFATLFVIVTAVGMLSLQFGTYELACHGHNDIVRHWTC